MSGYSLSPFWTWFRQQKRRILVIGVLASAVFHAIASVEKLRNSVLPESVASFLNDRLPMIPAVLHVIVLVGVVYLYLRDHLRLIDSARDLPAEVSSARNFYRYWAALVCCWIVQYTALAYRYWQSPDNAVVPDADLVFYTVLGNFLNNITSALFFLLYWELSEKTVNADGTRKSKSVPWEQLVIGLLILTVLDYVHLKTGFKPNWHYGFTVISGVLGCVSMALFIGRIDSKYIGLPVSLVVVLYVYASMQPLLALFEHHPVLGLAMFSLALVFKLVLFLIVYWLCADGVIFYYMRKLNELVHDREDDRARFLKRHFADAVVKEPAPTRVFVSLPMSSVAKEEKQALAKTSLAILRALRAKKLTAYSACEQKSQKGLALEAFRQDEHELRHCDYFVLIYPHQVASSVLVEVGMAIALEKRCLLLVKKGVELPFLLRGPTQEVDRVRTEHYETLDELEALIAERWELLASSVATPKEPTDPPSVEP